MKRFQAPAGIANHPSVEECLDGPSEGFEGYRYDVWLKEGWEFKRGRMAGCRGGTFNSVADFKFAQPIKKMLTGLYAL